LLKEEMERIDQTTILNRPLSSRQIGIGPLTFGENIRTIRSGLLSRIHPKGNREIAGEIKSHSIGYLDASTQSIEPKSFTILFCSICYHTHSSLDQSMIVVPTLIFGSPVKLIIGN
jgi:hypothetical protein